MASSAKNTAGKGSGKRRRFAGKTGVRVKTKGGYAVVPRAHTHGGHSQAAAGWSMGDANLGPQQQATKSMPGHYKVPAPTKRVHRKGTYGSISPIT